MSYVRQKHQLKTKDVVWEYCLRVLSQKAYSVKQLERKLTSRRVNPELIEQALHRLQELKLIDDEAYARMFIDARLRLRPRGAYALRQELRKRGIADDLIEKTIAEFEIDDYQIAQKLLKKIEQKLTKLPLQKRKQKSIHFLSSKGFSPDVIYDLLQKIT